MLGNFQQSNLRIEVEATEQTIRDSLLNTDKLKKWIFPQTLNPELPETLELGISFTSKLGFVEINHEVELLSDNCLRFLLSKGIDGYHEWCWGDGWIQSRLEGISLLPLNLGQTLSLLQLRQYLVSETAKMDSPSTN
ncbi:MAG: hypothetical protein QNJ70_14340 [Xenococcaceae cyanobacterium MO_207.B15]|nr:hypothetical protein [Xenococcaceae cyanobacterium MO_207.B15]